MPAPKSTLERLLVIAIGAAAIGVAGAYALDYHKHTCERCGARWAHLGALNGGNRPAHTCRTCGKVQWWKDGVPEAVKAHYRLFHPEVDAA